MFGLARAIIEETLGDVEGPEIFPSACVWSSAWSLSFIFPPEKPRFSRARVSRARRRLSWEYVETPAHFCSRARATLFAYCLSFCSYRCLALLGHGAIISIATTYKRIHEALIRARLSL